VLLELKGNQGPVRSVAFSPDGTRIVTGGAAGGAKPGGATGWDAEEGTGLLAVEGHTDSASSVAVSPGSERGGPRGTRRTVGGWAARARITIPALKGHTGGVTSVSFSADGAWLLPASGGMGGGGEVIVWDAPIPRPALELVGHTGGIGAVAFSPDSSRLAT